MHTWLKRRRGNALVEFAMIGPILVFLLMGILVTGLAINAKIVVSGAAREAGRTWAIVQSDSRARDKALDSIRGGGLPLRKGDLILFDPVRDVRLTRSGDYIYVTVTYRQPLFVPLVADLVRHGSYYMTLRSQSVFRVER